MIASPSLFDPVQNPRRAKQRRDAVLKRMFEQDMISPAMYRRSLQATLPGESDIRTPQPDSRQPYFTTWLTQQLVDRFKAPAVFSGGLKVRTTLDPELQMAAEQAISRRLTGSRAKRLPRCNREQDGRGQGDGGRHRFRAQAVQPRHERPPPARVGVQALHPYPSAPGRREPGGHLHLAEEDLPCAQLEGREVRGEQLRGLVRRDRLASLRHRAIRQLGLRRAGAQGGHEADRRACAARWGSGRRFRPTRP